jgi:hypothetical protein
MTLYHGLKRLSDFREILDRKLSNGREFSENRMGANGPNGRK